MDERRARQQQARARRAGQRRQRNHNKQNKTGMICVTVIVMCLMVWGTMRIVRLHHKNEDYKLREQQLTNQLELEQERQNEISAYEEYVTTPEYIEELAKTKLGLVKDNEIIFKEEKKEP